MYPADPLLGPIFDRTVVPGYRQLFALGVLGQPAPQFAQQPRVTLRCQQVRALNLAFALIHSGAIHPAAHLAVVGGGVAGVTIAAALSHHGYRVTVLERRPSLLPLQAGSTQRWLHPHLIDWPHAGSAEEEAGLPLLNWRAAPAGEVFRQLSAALTRYPMQVIGAVHELQLVPRPAHPPGPSDPAGAQGWELRFHNQSQHFDAVILAVGFGAEKTFPEVELRSYWDADNLDRDPVAAAVHSTHCFVSGTGDGGLIDFIRARLYRFDHQDTFRAFIQVAADPTLHQQLLRLDQDAGADPGRLATGYQTVSVPAAVDEFLRQRLHPQRSATLHGQQPWPYNPSASLLNRFIASRILRLDGPTGYSRYEQRPLVTPIARHGSAYQVHVTDGGALGPRYHARFDQVIIRHGTHSALALLPPPIAAACQQLATLFPAEPDPTRARRWPSDFFGPEPAPLAAATPPAPSAGTRPSLSGGIPTPQFQLADPPSVERPTRASLYSYLAEIFANATELENFVAYHFPNLARQLGAGMTFDQIARLLLADRGVHRVPRGQVLTAVRQRYPEPAARAERLLHPDPSDT